MKGLNEGNKRHGAAVVIWFGVVVLAGAPAQTVTAAEVDLKSKDLVNPAAYIPSQCYTRTEDAAGRVHNPCFTCHVRPRSPNYVSDANLQSEYRFPGAAESNNWHNLFKDRSAAIEAVSDAEILEYVRASNYFDADGGLVLANKLATAPAAWDFNNDGKWSGYVPDCHFNFDAEGFDLTPKGKPSGWRAFAYVPLPGGFWPTNGSTDDVLIRLPEIFRQTEDGPSSQLVYKLNLAIVEALILRTDVPIEPVDEKILNVDLDKDGTLGEARKVAFDWAPLKGRNMSYVGAARLAQVKGQVHLAAGLFPEGTEFLHTVRYIDTDDHGGVRMAARMKEVRYARKTRWQSYADLEEGALAESKERIDFPDRLTQFIGDIETGITNGTGWRYQGFIEDASGALRPQTYEETVFCMGCHSGLGITDDSNFAFPRKLPTGSAHAGGWFHWSQKGLQGTPDPVRADGKRELTTYLAVNGAGDEFRGNNEVIARFFTADGKLKPEAVAQLQDDISVLLLPSAPRALALDKAYREIVREQSYVFGRDTVITPGSNVRKQVDQGDPTGVEAPERAARW